MDSSSGSTQVEDSKRSRKWKTFVCVGVLFVVNLLNYMDRFTIAGVLTDIQVYYHIDDAQGGLLQTVFIVFFMIFSPICGFLGDRYNRKMIMICGILVWILAVLASTFIPANHFWLFLLMRGVVGIGEASYATISPTLIADMFSGQQRSHMLMVFYFAIPIGCGFGFIVGSSVAQLLGAWQWGVRITAILGAVSLALIFFLVEEPERGKAEREKGEIAVEVKATSYWQDILSLAKNITYISSTLGYTAIVFVVGTMSWWVPTAILHKDAWKEGLNSTDLLDPSSKSQVNMIFGALTCVGGIVGVSTGTMLSSWIRQGRGPFHLIQTVRSDAVVCAVGAVIGIPTFFFGIFLIDKAIAATWIMMAICITALCFNWATNVDMLMSVVVPHRRNTANSWQILTSHLLGDASGPYILGVISDAIRGSDDSPYAHFHSLVVSFYIPNVVLILSAILFALAAFCFPRDQRKFAIEMGVDPRETVMSSKTSEGDGGGTINSAFLESKKYLNS